MSLACDNIGAFPLSGTVPLGVWKLPHAGTVDISDNLLTQFTDKSTPNWFHLTQWGGDAWSTMFTSRGGQERLLNKIVVFAKKEARKVGGIGQAWK